VSILTKSIFEFKIVKVVAVIGVIAVGINYLVFYNSLDQRCARKFEKLSGYLPTQQVNKMQNAQLEAVKSQFIEQCVKNNGE
jgi:L-asparagine transporter-like permease